MHLLDPYKFANAISVSVFAPLVIVSAIATWEGPISTWSCFMNYVGVNIGSLHTAIAISYLTVTVLQRVIHIQSFHNAILLYKTSIYTIGSELLFVAFITCYQFLAIDHVCLDTDTDVIHNLYLTTMLLTASMFIVHVIILSTNIILYLKRRTLFWTEMQDMEQMLGIHPSLTSVFNEPFDPDKRAEFSKYWIDERKRSAYHIDTLKIKVQQVMRDMITDLDHSGDGSISYDEFMAYVKRQCSSSATSCCPTQRPHVSNSVAHKAWEALSHDGAINETSVLRLLGKVCQARQRFSYMLLTDRLVTLWQLLYLLPIVFGAAGVLIAQLWGYKAFYTGLDLFKLYIILLSWAVKAMENRIMFIMFMSTNRPYNIGDVLIVHGGVSSVLGPVSVKMITTGFTLVVGTSNTWLSNKMIMSSGQYISNLTASPTVGDSMDVEMSHVISDDVRLHIVTALSKEATRDVDLGVNPDVSSMRTEWHEIKIGSKLLRVFWTYNQVINDLGTYKLRTSRIRNLIDDVINDQMAIQAMVSTFGQGGAFNNRPEMDALQIAYPIRQ